LRYDSPNAPRKADILGTILLSVLAGHKRYAHVTTIRSDGVLPGLLGMKRVRSEDAVRRAFLKGEVAEYAQWLHTHLERNYEELLKEAWILDTGRDGEALVWTAGASRSRIQSHQARPAVARLPDVFYCGHPDGARCGGTSGQSDRFSLRAARVVDLAGSATSRTMAEVGAGRHRLGHGSDDGGM